MGAEPIDLNDQSLSKSRVESQHQHQRKQRHVHLKFKNSGSGNAAKTTTKNATIRGEISVEPKTPKEVSFTSEQRRIVNSRRKISQVIAVAGAAKTTTLVAKARKLIERGASPSSILFLTFSKSARDVLLAKLPPGVQCQTIHAFGLTLTLKAGLIPGLSGRTRPLTGKGQRKCLRKALKAVGRELDDSHPESAAFLRKLRRDSAQVKRLLSFIEKVRALGRFTSTELKAVAKTRGIAARHLSSIKKVSRRFAEVKAEAGRADYADMVRLGTTAINQGVPAGVAHVLVDEFQDCTPAQAQFLVALAGQLESLTVVGDPLQAIFGFAGARFVNLSELMEGVRDYPLTLSFRLHQGTAAMAAALGRLVKPNLLPIRGAGTSKDLPVVVRCKSRSAQNQAVMETIQHLTRASVAPERIAILGRTKAQVREAEQLLLANGMDTLPLYRSRQAGHVQAVLDLVVLVEHQLGKLDRPRLEQRVRDLARARDMPASTIKSCVDRLIKVSRSKSLVSHYRACAGVYKSAQGKALSKDGVADINRWGLICSRAKNAAEMRERMAEISSSQGLIVTSNIHQAKGGEWDYVLVLHAVEGSMPFFKARTPEQLTEELHSMYVAATRARKGLYFFDGPYKHARSGQSFSERSDFLTDPLVRQHLREVGARNIKSLLKGAGQITKAAK